MIASLRVQRSRSTGFSSLATLCRASSIVLLTGVLLLTDRAFAQQPDPFGQVPEAFGLPPGLFTQEPGAIELDDKGAVSAVQGHSLTLKLEKGEWVVTVGPQTKVSITGAADPEYLHTGLYVKFTGEIDKKGAVAKEIEQLEITAPPAKGSGGVYEGAGAEVKAVKAPAEGTTYQLIGRVNSYKGGELILMAGAKKLTAKIAAGATVAVNTSDVELAQPGDEVTVTGWYTDAHKPSFENSTPGYATADTLAIKLAKPLTSSKKTHSVAAKKTPASPKPAAPAAPPTNNSRNPFDN